MKGPQVSEIRTCDRLPGSRMGNRDHPHSGTRRLRGGGMAGEVTGEPVSGQRGGDPIHARAGGRFRQDCGSGQRVRRRRMAAGMVHAPLIAGSRPTSGRTGAVVVATIVRRHRPRCFGERQGVVLMMKVRAGDEGQRPFRRATAQQGGRHENSKHATSRLPAECLQSPPAEVSARHADANHSSPATETTTGSPYYCVKKCNRRMNAEGVQSMAAYGQMRSWTYGGTTYPPITRWGSGANSLASLPRNFLKCKIF